MVEKTFVKGPLAGRLKMDRSTGAYGFTLGLGPLIVILQTYRMLTRQQELRRSVLLNVSWRTKAGKRGQRVQNS